MVGGRRAAPWRSTTRASARSRAADRERAQQEHGARRHAGDDQEQPDGRTPPAADHQREAEPDHAATGDVTIRPSRTVTSRRA